MTIQPWRRKSIASLLAAAHHHSESSSSPSWSVWDLISIGVGGTIGSGIFVLAGLIAHNYAGPATFGSFLLSGGAAACSALCFAEWAGRLPPVNGSTYTYVYVSLGEGPAVWAAACLTLEYAVSGAAVARSWGDKLVDYRQLDDDNASSFFNPLAGLISTVAVVILACGVRESKAVTNFFTLLKVALVLFMIGAGFSLFQWDNFVGRSSNTSFAPYGVKGVVRGATSSFFGYLGYDEVCCLAAEAKNPAVDMPRAVLWTLGIVTVLYVLASIALVGMLPYQDISTTSGFPAAFAAREMEWASHMTAVGELVTLPVVVLVSLLAQPRLCAAMANDGLLPEIFARETAHGNLLWSTLLCGVPMIVVATFVPFSYLDDCISVGILFAFNMTNSSLLLMRCSSCCGSTYYATPTTTTERDDAADFADDDNTQSTPERRSGLCPHTLLRYHALALTAGLVASQGGEGLTWLAWLLGAIMVAWALRLHWSYPPMGHFGDTMDMNLLQQQCTDPHDPVGSFQTPLVPFLPLIGCTMNWYLIAQLEVSGLVLLLVYLAMVSFWYCWSCSHRADITPEERTDVTIGLVPRARSSHDS